MSLERSGRKVAIMQMIEIVSPTLSEYMVKVRNFASKYAKPNVAWYELTEDVITCDDDRDEFSFIRMALWDKLIDEEFFPSTSPPSSVSFSGQCGESEPGTIPGSFILESTTWAHTNTQNSLIAY